MMERIRFFATTPHILYVAAFVIAITTFLTTQNPVSAGFCSSLSEASSNDKQFAGGEEGSWFDPIDGLTGSRAELYYDEPQPVWHSSWFYTMVNPDNQTQWVQIGWIRTGENWGGDEAPFDGDDYGDSGDGVVFLQYGDGDIDTKYWNGTVWTDNFTNAVTPSTGDLYQVYEVEIDNEKRWRFKYENSSFYTTSTSWEHDWDAKRVVVSGETTDYVDDTPLDRGDHFPGHGFSHVQANQSEKLVDGTWEDTELSTFDFTDIGAVTLNNTGGGDGITVYDTRCNS